MFTWTDSYYQIWQKERYGNVLGSDGLLHDQSETHHMVDDEVVMFIPDELENGQRDAEAFAGRMDQHFELLLLNDCY